LDAIKAVMKAVMMASAMADNSDDFLVAEMVENLGWTG